MPFAMPGMGRGVSAGDGAGDGDGVTEDGGGDGGESNPENDAAETTLSAGDRLVARTGAGDGDVGPGSGEYDGGCSSNVWICALDGCRKQHTATMPAQKTIPVGNLILYAFFS
ncbi:hypothetical protein MLD38_023223 [Melastoma candidum]|uniref:Uncharacterized protein n=1 Tax=Melastoma candidum TaxID=119954 RepID=A0ACB9QQB0_9MYRT|nr:hypothetical protein MLD38_023223 [Melastoma candidum]